MRLVIETPGVRHDYACDPKPCGLGGYAAVFPATHKPTGKRVALKRLESRIDDDAHRRMRREVAALRKLAGQPHVMPVLDADEDSRWYVMPLAEGDLTKYQTPFPDRTTAEVLAHAAVGLAHAHAHDYIHRDVKPPNILRLGADEDGPARWVVADWGLVRNPRGMTTTLLTPTGRVIGTDGFIAPEVLRGAHAHATEKADVYSLGRVALWAATGEVPLAGEERLPTGPFRQLVRAATRAEPNERVGLAEFQELLMRVSFEPPPPPTEVAAELRQRVRRGDMSAATSLYALADEKVDDAELLLDYVAPTPGPVLQQLAAADPDQIRRLLDAMRTHLHENFGDRQFDSANIPLRWMENVGRAASAVGDLGLLEDAAGALFDSDARWARYEQRRYTRNWLMQLSGPAARTVARALQANPAAVQWYLDEDWKPSRNTDPAIRGALQAP